jgi:hypothetical protein
MSDDKTEKEKMIINEGVIKKGGHNPPPKTPRPDPPSGQKPKDND